MARATPEKAATKSTAKKAAAKKAAEKKEDGEKQTRRPGGERGWLAAEIDKVLRKEDASMSVNDIVSKVTNVHGEHPSSGAVSAALQRWAEQGYIETTAGRPLSFKKFTRKYAQKTLADFLEDQREERRKARAAAKEA